MSARRSRHKVAGLAVALLLLVLIAPLQGVIHRERPDLFDLDRKTRRTSVIAIGPTPAVIASLGGFRTVAADLLWLKTERVWNGGDWWLMLPLLDAVTQLDPQFILAWKVYGWHAAYNLHAASATRSEKRHYLNQGIEALERAVEANPDTWELQFELGWTLYDRAHEPWRAAQYFYQADQSEDAPHYVTRMYYRCFEHVMDFDRLFPALEYAMSKHTDVDMHQQKVKENYDWWIEHRDDPREHRRQIVLENTARKQRAVDPYLYPDDPYWDVCPVCGLPSAKGSPACQNPLCQAPLHGLAAPAPAGSGAGQS